MSVRSAVASHPRRVVLGGAAALAAVALAVVAVVAVPGGPSAPQPLRPSLAPVVAAATPQPPEHAPASPVTRPAVPHDAVPAAAPRSFSLSGPAFTITADVCGMADVRPLNPPGDEHDTVCWVRKGFGVAPGSRSGTTYVLGHSWAPDPREVLNKASSRATRDVLAAKPVRYDGVRIYPAPSLLGYHLTLRTPQGRLTYTVRKSYGTRKADLGTIGAVMDEQTPDRVVLITCAESRGVDYDYNIVLEAFLTSSQRAVRTA